MEKQNNEETHLQERVDALCKDINEMIDRYLPTGKSSDSRSFERLFRPKSREGDLSFEWHGGDMVGIKLAYLKQLLQRGRCNSKDYLQKFATSYYTQLKDKSFVEEAIERFYVPPEDETFKYSHRDPLSWMVVDICFIIEFIYKCTNDDLIEENDPIFLRGRNLQKVVQSMFELSYQIPFCLLKEFFHITEEEENGFIDVVACFMERELCLGPIHVDRHHHLEEAEHLHLLDFVLDMWIKSSELGRETLVKVGRRTGRQQIIRNVTELQRAGVGFKGVNRPTFDLKFRPGLLEIPVLSITTETENFLRNVIAMEETLQGDNMLVVNDYCFFKYCLIQSPEDVQLLRECGAIKSYLRDDKDVVALFERLGKRVPSSTYFCYSDLFYYLNVHCFRKWNSWLGKFEAQIFSGRQ